MIYNSYFLTGSSFFILYLLSCSGCTLQVLVFQAVFVKSPPASSGRHGNFQKLRLHDSGLSVSIRARQ